MSELRLAFRRLTHRRGVMLISIMTLATSIGAAAATWSLLSAVLLRPLPVRDPHSLVLVATQNQLGGRTYQGGFIYPTYRNLKATGVFDVMAAVWANAVPVPVGEQKSPYATPVMFVSGEFFDVLGVPIPLGRALDAADDRRGVPPVAVLSDRYWRTALNADPSIVGKTVRVAGKDVTIVGIAGRGFRGVSLAQAPAMFLPLETIADVGPAYTNYFADPRHNTSPTAGITVVGRMRSGQTAEQVIAQLRALPEAALRGERWQVVDINTAAVPAASREGTTRFGRLLGSTVALLLLIGCSTVGLLLLVRTEARKEEFATCLALGASRARLAGSVVIEGAILTAIGAALAPLVAHWLFSAVSTFQLPGGISLGLLELKVDPRAVAVSTGCAALATLVIAVVAGASGFRADIADALRARAGATPRITRRRTRAVLLATQVAVALALVAGTGLFIRSLMAALDLNRHLDSARVVVIDNVPSSAGYSEPRAAALFEDLRQRLRGNAVVRSVATSSSQGGMSAGGTLTIDGEPRTFPYFVALRCVDDSYFETLRLRILRGRDFSSADVAGAPMVGIVSESFGRMIASAGDPIGRRIVTMFGKKLEIEIVGVADDLFTDIRDAEPLALYLPLAQRPLPVVSRALAFRATGNADAARREVIGSLKQIDPDLDVAPGLTLDERLLRQMAPQQFGLLVLGSLGGIALLLTVLGTYVLAETTAVMRMREMGIRAALGATSANLIGIVLRETATLVGIGLTAGLLLTWLGASTVGAFLFQVQPLDPVTLGMVAGLILIVAIAVSVRPAIRAGRVDLAAVLRAE